MKDAENRIQVTHLVYSWNAWISNLIRQNYCVSNNCVCHVHNYLLEILIVTQAIHTISSDTQVVHLDVLGLTMKYTQLAHTKMGGVGWLGIFVA